MIVCCALLLMMPKHHCAAVRANNSFSLSASSKFNFEQINAGDRISPPFLSWRSYKSALAGWVRHSMCPSPTFNGETK